MSCLCCRTGFQDDVSTVVSEVSRLHLVVEVIRLCVDKKKVPELRASSNPRTSRGAAAVSKCGMRSQSKYSMSWWCMEAGVSKLGRTRENEQYGEEEEVGGVRWCKHLLSCAQYKRAEHATEP